MRTSVIFLAAKKASGGTIRLTFIKPDGSKVVIPAAPVGDSLLEIAHANKVEIEGACGGETACSTCHVILRKADFDKVPEPSEAEEDMLDLALGLTPTSRLGCQVFAAPELDGIEVTMPKEVNNMQK